MIYVSSVPENAPYSNTDEVLLCQVRTRDTLLLLPHYPMSCGADPRLGPIPLVVTHSWMTHGPRKEL